MLNRQMDRLGYMGDILVNSRNSSEATNLKVSINVGRFTRILPILRT